MRSETKSPVPREVTRRSLTLRFALAGATLGLITGFWEARFLYFTPRVPTLLEPDVSYVIWFLAPLIGILIFALVGAGLGLAAGLGHRRSSVGIMILVSAGLGAAAFYSALAIGLTQYWVLIRVTPRMLAVPSACFLALFASALGLLLIWQRRSKRFLQAATSWAVAPLAKALLAAVVICVSGLAFYAAHLFTRRLPTSPPSATPNRRPNIVLIVLDTVRAGELSAFGYPRPTTPNLDRLARQGVLFENAFAPSSWTLPSDVSMLTGLLPHQHGANWATPPTAGLRTLAEDLESHGYETAGFNANLTYGLAGWGLSQGFELYEDDSSSARHNLALTLAGRVLLQPLYGHLVNSNPFDRRNAGEVNRDIFRWFRSRSKRPFFLFVNYFDAHYPYEAPAPYDHRFGKVSETAILRATGSGYRGYVPESSLEEREALITAYDNCLAYLDDQVGQLLQFFARSPEWANTVIIVTSDHGEAFGEHGVYGHGINLYHEVLHVPLIAVGPGIPAGMRITHMARLRQIFQTVIDLVSSPTLLLDRSSLRRFWTPAFKPLPSDDVALSELITSISLTTPRWHYIYSASGRSELYQWTTDPEERIDLSEHPESRDTLQVLRVLLGQRVGRSVMPWHGPEYLVGLRQPEFRSLLDERLLTAESPVARYSSTGTQPSPEDRDLLNNLPYR